MRLQWKMYIKLFKRGLRREVRGNKEGEWAIEMKSGKYMLKVSGKEKGACMLSECTSPQYMWLGLHGEPCTEGNLLQWGYITVLHV